MWLQNFRLSVFHQAMSKRAGFEDGINGQQYPSKATKSNGSDKVKAGPSPPPKSGSPANAAALAAAAAARISAQLAQKKSASPSPRPPSAKPAVPRPPSPAPPPMPKLGEGEYMEDDVFVRDIEINDLRNRYLLTKRATQQTIIDGTGVEIITKGRYYPDKLLASERDPPLHLQIRSKSKDGLDAAVAQIQEIIDQQLGSLVDDRRFRRRDDVERDELGRRKWPEEKIPIGMENKPGFNLRAQIVGPGGAFVKHIQQETKCKVQIKGRGSGFIEPSTGKESEEDIYLWVAGPDTLEVQRAKSLCEDLIKSVRDVSEGRASGPAKAQSPPKAAPQTPALSIMAGAPGMGARGSSATSMGPPSMGPPGMDDYMGQQQYAPPTYSHSPSGPRDAIDNQHNPAGIRSAYGFAGSPPPPTPAGMSGVRSPYGYAHSPPAPGNSMSYPSSMPHPPGMSSSAPMASLPHGPHGYGPPPPVPPPSAFSPPPPPPGAPPSLSGSVPPPPPPPSHSPQPPPPPPLGM